MVVVGRHAGSPTYVSVAGNDTANPIYLTTVDRPAARSVPTPTQPPTAVDAGDPLPHAGHSPHHRRAPAVVTAVRVGGIRPRVSERNAARRPGTRYPPPYSSQP